MSAQQIFTSKFRTEESLAEIALNFRRMTHNDNEDFFNPEKAIEFLKSNRLKGQTKPLTIERIPEQSIDVAFVRHDPPRLFVKEGILIKARLKLAESSFILKHELGHIVLHSNYQQNFTRSSGLESQWVRENNVEWQADTFARYVSAPFSLASNVGSVIEMQERFVLPKSVAELHFQCIKSTRERIALRNSICFQCATTYVRLEPSDDVCPSCISKMLSGGI